MNRFRTAGGRPPGPSDLHHRRDAPPVPSPAFTHSKGLACASDDANATTMPGIQRQDGPLGQMASSPEDRAVGRLNLPLRARRKTSEPDTGFGWLGLTFCPHDLGRETSWHGRHPRDLGGPGGQDRAGPSDLKRQSEGQERVRHIPPPGHSETIASDLDRATSAQRGPGTETISPSESDLRDPSGLTDLPVSHFCMMVAGIQ
jgi:hypothetical protein